MSFVVSQITDNAIVCLTAWSEWHQRKFSSWALQAFGKGNHRGSHKWPAMRKAFPCYYIIIITRRRAQEGRTLPRLLSWCCVKSCLMFSSFERIQCYQIGLTLIPAWLSNYIHCKVWDEITYLFLNFNGATVEVYEWISNFIPHFIKYVITYPCWD